MKIRMLLVAMLGLSLSDAALAQATSPFVGTWKLNLAKSKYDPGPPPKASQDVNTEVSGAMRSVQEWVDAEGKTHHEEWTAKFDGKDYPVTGADAGTTISLVRTAPSDLHVVDWVWKVAGKVAVSGRTVYSKDGKIRTISSKGANAAGKATTSTRVYERQ